MSIDLATVIGPKDANRYASCYCEENVWWLARRALEAGAEAERLRVVFVSNAAKTIPLWRQRAGGDGPVCWDYHVFLLGRSEACWSVWDLDTTLPFPCPFPVYFEDAIRPDAGLQPQFHRSFCVIDAYRYVAQFCSDRSHMWVEEGQRWMQAPPPWDPISVPGLSNTLRQYWDVEEVPESHPLYGSFTLEDSEMFRAAFS